ncbi:MAG: hypothetical protein JNL98_36930 [Bryobacterales bacterium]|nr:hypothetical protein [Bryobacterales bacterium]
MKRIWLTFALSAAVCFAVAEQKQAETKAPVKSKTAPTKSSPTKTASAAKKPAPKPQPITIPKDAKEISPGTFRHVDAKGQAWIYQQTPFGLMRGPEPKDAHQDPIPTDWTATEEGDSITFERPWPFGGSKRWTVKKAEMTGTEQAVWQRLQAAKQSK